VTCMTCAICNGTGKVKYRMLGDAMPTDVGNGVSVQAMDGWGTKPCACVKDLPAIAGVASWWDLETIYSKVVTVPIGNECAEITADCEIPRNDNGRRLHRTAENAYYPPLIRFEVPGHMTLHSDTAREMAAALIAAADACDKADELSVAVAFDERQKP
jgi:hypothetical protein